MKQGKKRNITSTPDEKSRPIYLKRHRFNILKKTPDFVAFVKLGRIVNSIAFCSQILTDYQNDQSPTALRHFFRSAFISAGYLHEAIELVHNMRMAHIKEPEFKNLYDLAIDPAWQNERFILEEMRNLAFHLDKWDKVTSVALLTLPPYRYALMAGERIENFYFYIGDEVDVRFVINRVKNRFPDMTDNEVEQHIFQVIPEMMKKFLNPTFNLMVELGKKLHFSESLD